MARFAAAIFNDKKNEGKKVQGRMFIYFLYHEIKKLSNLNFRILFTEMARLLTGFARSTSVIASLVLLLTSSSFLVTSAKDTSNDAAEKRQLNTASAAKTSQEILNDIVNYGLDRTRYLVDVLERKIFEQGLALNKTDPAHFVAVFNKQTPRAKELSRYGYATLEASTLLTKQ